METKIEKLQIVQLILFSLIIFFVGAFFSKVEGATLYLMPQSQKIYQGESFIIDLRLDTEGEEINAIGLNLKFPSDLLNIVDFSKGNSILTFWAEGPLFKKDEVSFTGGVPGGFKGEGSILKINFLGRKIGEGEVVFKETSQVLLNDGKGTPAFLSFLVGNYEIIGKPEDLPLISSRTHPEQNKWYNINTLHLHWDLIEGAEYSFILSQDPLAEPDDIPDRPEGELTWMGDMEYMNLEDGIYYFSLKQKLPAKDWSEKVTFRIMVDVTLPEEFKPEIGKDPTMFEGKYFLVFSATDKTSGIGYYEVLEERDRGEGIWKIAKSPYLLEDQGLESAIKVKAVDKAGNEKIVEISPPAKPSSYLIITLILVAIVIIGWIIKKYLVKKTLLLKK